MSIFSPSIRTTTRTHSGIVFLMMLGLHLPNAQSQNTMDYNDHGLGLERVTVATTDLAALPIEGVLMGFETVLALASDARFDLSYCSELSSAIPSNPKAEYVVLCIPKGTGNLSWNLSRESKMNRDGTMLPSDQLPRYGPVVLKSGQTLRIVNFDSMEDDSSNTPDAQNSAIHRLHTFNLPCHHQPRYMPPALYDDKGLLVAASYYDCPTAENLEFNSLKEDGTSSTYNHESKAPFFVEVTVEGL